VTALVRALARLAALGVPMRLHALWDGYREPVDPATRVQPKLVVPLCGANHEKPYPPPGGAAELPPPNPPRPSAVAKAAPAMTDRPVSRKAPEFSPAPAPMPAAMVEAPAPMPGPAPMPAPAPMVAASMPTPAPMVVGGGWLGAWQEAQRQTAQTHALVQQSMASSQAAYLRATESSLIGLAAMAGVSLPGGVQQASVAAAPQAWAPALS